MKKILSVIISVFIVMTIMSTVPVCATSATDVNISVDVSFYDVTVTVKSGYDNITAILKNKENTKLYGMYSSYSPEEAGDVKVHTFSFKMPDNESDAPTGVYVLYAGNNEVEASKEFNFVTTGSKVAFYNTLNDKTADRIKDFFADDVYKYAVPVDLTEYKNLESKAGGKAFGLVNEGIADFAATYEDIAENDTASLTTVDQSFKDTFAALMNVAELSVVESDVWENLAEQKIANGEFDGKYYVANDDTAILLKLSDVFSYYETERAKINTLSLTEYQKAFDKATLRLLSKSDFGSFRAGFIYFKDKSSIAVSGEAWSNIQSLINSGNDSTLWRNIKERSYASCDEMVADIAAEAQKLLDSNNAGGSLGGGGLGGGGGIGGGVGGGSASVDKPVAPSGSGTVSGGNTPDITPVEPSVTGTFSDVLKTHWACDSIEALAKEGILNGKGNGKFAPDDGVTREEFVKIIVVAFDLSADGENSFADVASDRWSADYISAAASNGIVTGDGENFNPTAVITRQDMAVIIHRVFEKLGTEISGDAISFDDDAEISDYAKEAIKALTGAGIINGMGDGTFAPKANVTRAQAAKVVYGLLSLSGGGK